MNRICKFSHLRAASALIICLAVLPPVTAQESHIYAPFVSKLRAVPKDNTVKITWTDSGDITGLYRIYRSSTPITAESFDTAEVAGTAAAGTQVFIDTIPVTGDYHYAVVAEENGEPCRIFIPFRNTTAGPVSITVLTPEERAVRIEGIRAEVKNSSVIVNFTPSRTDRHAIIYRNTRPMTRPEDLLDATVLKTIESADRVYQDYPVPGVSYYYAVLDRGLVEYGRPALQPGENSTTSGVAVALGTEKTAVLPPPLYTGPTYAGRNVPLPTLLIARSLETGTAISAIETERLPEKKELTPAAGKAVSALLAGITTGPAPAPVPELLPEDRAAGRSAEDVTLFHLLESTFASRKYDETLGLLENYLTMPRSESVKTRTRFYIGQCLFFQGKYEKAVLEFLMVRESFYTAAQPWIDRSLLALAGR